MKRSPRQFVCALVVLGSLAACANTDEAEYVERPAEELYAEGQDLLNDQSYRSAAKAFEEVERQHPYSQWAVRGRLMSAYAYYEGEMYIEAQAALQSFIDLHPGHKDVPYAYYLLARSYYDQISDVGRDQEMTREALAAFEELMRRFPDSDYARDATLKADLARDHLAGKEMEIGRYYQNRQQYVAAINRFQNVVDTYQTTTHVPEALHRLTESYLALGVIDEAKASAAVLGHNYPESDWYTRSFSLIETGTQPEGGVTDGWFGSLF